MGRRARFTIHTADQFPGGYVEGWEGIAWCLGYSGRHARRIAHRLPIERHPHLQIVRASYAALVAYRETFVGRGAVAAAA